jgi:hypothetical protein
VVLIGVSIFFAATRFGSSILHNGNESMTIKPGKLAGLAEFLEEHDIISLIRLNLALFTLPCGDV